jgi:hypothetical protein
MPTKPTPAVVPEWNTGAANRSTPSGGKIALGWEAEESPSSSTFNWWMFTSGEILAWVLDGSNAGEEDAHLVETSSTGATTIAQVTITGRAGGTYGLQATGSSGAGPATGVRGIGTGNAVGVSGTGGSGAAGHGVVGTGSSTAGAYGVRGVAAGTNNTGVRGEGIGDGAGCSCVGGASGPGGVFTGGGGNEAGAEGTGVGTGAGFDGLGGATGPGVRGTAGGVAAQGGFFDSHLSGSSSGTGCTGRGRSDATGVYGTAADGYGVVCESDDTSPTRSALRVVPQNADPTTLLDGDVWQNSTTDELSVRQNSGTRRLVWRTAGQCDAYAENSGVTSDNSATFTNACSVSLASPNEPKRTGVVRIRVTGEVGRDSAGSIDIRVRDTTSSATVATRNVVLYQTATFERDIAWAMSYTLPASGARNFEVQIASNSSGGGNVSIRNVTITIDGVY